MRIEGAGVTDHLKIIYTHIVDSDWLKEFWFIINMVTRDYQGLPLSPRSPQKCISPVWACD